MGIFTPFRNSLNIVGYGKNNAGSLPATRTTGILSPPSWSGAGQLSQIVWSDIFGNDTAFISRADAMSIPAVAKARNLLVSLISANPLVALDVQGILPNEDGGDPANPDRQGQPVFLTRTDGIISPWHRMVWTVDDLFFYGWSLWEVLREEVTDAHPEGRIIAAERIAIEDWRFDEQGQVIIGTDTVDSEDVILIPGPHEGILTQGARTLRGSIALESQWINKANSPIPLVELHMLEDNGLDQTEIDAWLNDYYERRNDPKGTAMITPPDMELRTHGEVDPALFIEGRNFVRLDVAAFAGLPGASMDGSLSTASLTYSTNETASAQIDNFATPLWTGAIEGRLSQDDVVPSGQRVRFDLSNVEVFPPNPTGQPVKD